MGKTFWAILGVIVVAFVGVYALTGNKDKTSSVSDKYSNGNYTEVKASDYVRGKGTKNVTLIEYGDFQCPACRGYYPIVEQIVQSYGDDIKYVYRQFPLFTIHKNALAAHRAAEAAGKQGKFWEMYHKLYENQLSWSESNSAASIFEGYAQDLGLDMTRFKADVPSAEVNAAINADIESGQKGFTVSSTPTFILDGTKIETQPDFNAMKKQIDDEIKKVNPTQATPAPQQ